jgi:hypothetical protein
MTCSSRFQSPENPDILLVSTQPPQQNVFVGQAFGVSDGEYVSSDITLVSDS